MCILYILFIYIKKEDKTFLNFVLKADWNVNFFTLNLLGSKLEKSPQTPF